MQNIEKYLKTDEYKSRTQLRAETGLSDRDLRREIAALKKHRPVIYRSDANFRGYRLARPLDGLTPEETEKELDAVNHCIAEIESRKAAMSHYECTYIAYAKVAEKKLSVAVVGERYD